jgi:beta-phosphoglucomutase
MLGAVNHIWNTMPLNLGKVKFPIVMAAGLRAGAGGGGGATDGFDHVADWMLSPAAKVVSYSTRPGLQGVLFDLDGVLVNTAASHYRAWWRLAQELGIPFDERINQAFRGVGRMECLDKLLGEHGRFFALEEKIVLAERKNAYYLEYVEKLGPRDVAPGAAELVRELKQSDVRCAVVSASKNARLVLSLLAIEEWFDVIIDGTQVTRGKPHPEGFTRAAERMRVRPERCVVIEDAEAGVTAARSAGMKTVGIGVAAFGADFGAAGLERMSLLKLEGMVADAECRI